MTRLPSREQEGTKTKVTQHFPSLARQLSVSRPGGLAPTSEGVAWSLILDG
jgi:hypothetical protein